LEKHINSAKRSEPTSRRPKSRVPVPRDTKQVRAELVGKLREKLDPKVAVASTGKEHHGRGLGPNLDRLTVGVDLGDQWSHYCILGLERETLAEGQVRTTQEDFAIFFRSSKGRRNVECGLALRRSSISERLRALRIRSDLAAIATYRKPSTRTMSPSECSIPEKRKVWPSGERLGPQRANK
jgi:hypothetical protein